jgi:hypothetical protein
VKHLLIILTIFYFTSNLYSQECDETTISRMIKSGISNKTTEEQCGKIVEKEKSSENINNDYAKEIQSIRLAIGVAYGTFKYSDSYNTELSGDFDHDLNGAALGVSYIMVNENSFLYGGGLSLVSVNGPGWVSSKHRKLDSYTYYTSTLGYFEKKIFVKHFAAGFFYGLIGFNFHITDDILFQPNMRIGLKSLDVSWEEYIDFRSSTNVRTNYREDSSEIGLEIDLPFMYKIDSSFKIGWNLCLCRSTTEVSNGTGKYYFTSLNTFRQGPFSWAPNLLFDFVF